MIHYFLFAFLLVFLVSLPILTFWLWKKEKNSKIKEVPLVLWRKWRVYFFVILGAITSSFVIPINKKQPNKERKTETVQIKKRDPVKITQTESVSKLWNVLVFEKGGCLVGEQYVNKKGLRRERIPTVFNDINWKKLSNKEKEKLTNFLITKLSDTTKTKIHTCPFFVTTTGEMAVYSLQHILKKNWFDFFEFKKYKGKESKSATEQPQMWLQSILKNEKSRKKLAELFEEELKK